MPATEFERVSRGEAWHNSGLDTLESCERQWWLENVAKIDTPAKLSTVAGTAYHAAMEVWDTARMSGETIDSGTLFQVGMDSIREQLRDADCGMLSAYGGMDALRSQLQAALWHWENTLDTQMHLTLQEWQLAHIPLRLETYSRAPFVPGARDIAGTFDAFYRNEDYGHLTLVDHKTTAKMEYWRRDENLKRMQAVLYGALSVLDPTLPAEELPSVTYLVSRRALPKRKNSRFEGVRIIQLQPTLADVQRLRERVVRAEEALERNTFLPNPAAQWCSTCPFHNRCQETSELAVSLPLLRTRLLKETTP